MLRFARSVHHAAHHRYLHFLNAGMAAFPDRHLLAQVRLYLLGHLLEESTGSSTASRAGGNLRSETADTERLQNLLRHANFFRAVASRSRCQRYANGIADALL